MKKLKMLFLLVVMTLCFAACGGKDNEAKDDTKKDNVSTENVGSVEGTDDTVGREEEEENKMPVPSEKYVLYKEGNPEYGSYSMYEYNEKGHVTKKTIRSRDGVIQEAVYTYTYNADGSYGVYIDDPYEDITEEYDAKGRLVSKVDYDSTTTYVYDDKDRVMERKIVSKTGLVRHWAKMTYDENGFLVKEQQFFEDNTPSWWYEYINDADGKMIQKKKYLPDGELDSEGVVYAWSYEYDEFGRVTLEMRKDAERGGTYEKYYYEYDEAGGMCKKTDEVNNRVYEYKPLSQCVVQ